MEALQQAYSLAKKNDGAPGIDGVTFEAIEAQGVDVFLTGIRDELTTRTYRPLRSRRTEIPKDGGKVRVLSIPAIRDRVVQGALKLILEPLYHVVLRAGQILELVLIENVEIWFLGCMSVARNSRKDQTHTCGGWFSAP